MAVRISSRLSRMSEMFDSIFFIDASVRSPLTFPFLTSLRICSIAASSPPFVCSALGGFARPALVTRPCAATARVTLEGWGGGLLKHSCHPLPRLRNLLAMVETFGTFSSVLAGASPWPSSSWLPWSPCSSPLLSSSGSAGSIGLSGWSNHIQWK